MAAASYPHGLSDEVVKEGRRILDQDTSVVAIGIIKDEFVAFCEGLKLCYDEFLRPEETLTHPQKLWMHSTTDFLLAFASKVPLKNVVCSTLNFFCIFTISTFECS